MNSLYNLKTLKQILALILTFALSLSTLSHLTVQAYSSQKDIQLDSRVTGILEDSSDSIRYDFKISEAGRISITFETTGSEKPTGWTLYILDEIDFNKEIRIGSSQSTYTTAPISVVKNTYFILVMADGQFSNASYALKINSISDSASSTETKPDVSAGTSDSNKQKDATSGTGAIQDASNGTSDSNKQQDTTSGTGATQDVPNETSDSNKQQDTVTNVSNANATYKILTGRQTMSGVDKFYIECPSYGYISLSSSKEMWFTMDNDAAYNSVTKASELSRYVNAGTHIVHTTGSPQGWYASEVSYTFYPQCTIYYMDNGNAIKLDSYQLTKTKQTMSLPENFDKLSGYKVSGWYLDSSLTKAVSVIDKSVGEDWYLYPKKEAIQYVIEYELDGGTNSSENPKQYTIEDNEITLKSPAKDGYIFKGWYTLEQGKKSYIQKIQCSNLRNIKIFADWEKDSKIDSSGEESTKKATTSNESSNQQDSSAQKNDDTDAIENDTEEDPDDSIEISINKENIVLDVKKKKKLKIFIESSGDSVDTDELTWKSSNKNIAKVTKDGLVTGVSAGRATISAYYPDYDISASCEVTVYPVATTIVKLTSDNGNIKVKWKKTDSGIDGYEVVYSDDKTFSDSESVTSKGWTNTAKNIKNLIGKTKYYVKVRAYKKVKGKKYYSKWAKVKSVTVK